MTKFKINTFVEPENNRTLHKQRQITYKIIDIVNDEYIMKSVFDNNKIYNHTCYYIDSCFKKSFVGLINNL